MHLPWTFSPSWISLSSSTPRRSSRTCDVLVGTLSIHRRHRDFGPAPRRLYGLPNGPSMCGATAALWEATFHQLIRDQVLTSKFLCSSRYVDNRCLLRFWDGNVRQTTHVIRPGRLRTPQHRGNHDPLASDGWFNEIYLRQHFYGLPLELEHVPGMEILGTVVDTAQRQIQLILPQQSISLYVLRAPSLLPDGTPKA